MKRAQTTITTVVMEALIAHDDFISLDTIVAATKLTRHAVQGALLYLRKCRAIDSVESGGHLYWYPTPEYDQRSKQVKERSPEEEKRTFKGRRPGQRAKKLNY